MNDKRLNQGVQRIGDRAGVEQQEDIVYLAKAVLHKLNL
jgi:hypothetical protein